jgi:hypothetical protein
LSTGSLPVASPGVTIVLTRRAFFRGGLLAATIWCAWALSARAQTSKPGQEANDLDAFMARVLQHRSDNWKTLRDYVLNEKEHFELLGPGRVLLFGTQREYTWYLRDGLLVRSPLRFDGVAIAADARARYEETWTQQEHSRAERQARRKARGEPAPDLDLDDVDDEHGSAAGSDAHDGGSRVREQADDVTALAREGAEPRIISQAYFMNFHFEPGNYYLAGREAIDGRQVLRIEYYPQHLFDERRRQRRGAEAAPGKNQKEEQEIERKLNKVALVTLWVDPQEYQIVKFTFANVDFGFLPGRWLVRADDMTASMVMSQPLHGIWLPREISGSGQITLANGTYTLRYDRQFFDYQQGEVKTKIQGYTPAPKDR